MPAILRIFVYQTDASQSVIGSSQSYGTIVGHRVDLSNGMAICNIMRFCRCVYRSVLRTSVPDHYFFLRVFLRYWA